MIDFTLVSHFSLPCSTNMAIAVAVNALLLLAIAKLVFSVTDFFVSALV